MSGQLIAIYDENLIRNTLESYRRGREKHVKALLENSNDSLEQKLRTSIETRLSLTDQLLIRRFSKIRNRGLIVTRQGDFIAAENLFSVAKLVLQGSYELSPEGNLLFKSYLLQAEAYLDYCRGNYDQAYSRTIEALAIDVILEDEYKYEAIVLHRIQLVHNLVRIDARCMYLERAIELACQILNYLEGRLEVLPIPGPWGCKRVARQPQEFVAAMFVQVTSEIALILAGKDRQLAHTLFTVGCTHLHLEANANYHCHPRAYTWLLVKQAFINQDSAKFLKGASDFFIEGYSDIPLLWYATAIDLVTLCNELNLPDSELIKQEIARETLSSKYLPQKLASLLRVYAKI